MIYKRQFKHVKNTIRQLILYDTDSEQQSKYSTTEH